MIRVERISNMLRKNNAAQPGNSSQSLEYFLVFVSLLVCLELCLCCLTTQRLLFVSHWKHTRFNSDPVPEFSYKTVNYPFTQVQHLLWSCL